MTVGKALVCSIPLFGAALLAGCTSREPLFIDESQAIDGGAILKAQTSSDLARWPNDEPIRVCFSPFTTPVGSTDNGLESGTIIDFSDPGAPGRAAAVVTMNLVQTAIEEWFEPIAGLEFEGWEICENHEQGTLHGQIRIALQIDWWKTSGGDGSYFQAQSNNDGSVTWRPIVGFHEDREGYLSLRYSAGVGPSDIVALALHEMGHALGLQHEHDHADSIVAIEVIGGAATCVPRTPSGTFAGQVRLTNYDPLGIMGYGYCGSGRTLSRLDIAALGFIYDPREDANVAGTNQIILGDGSRIIYPGSEIWDEWQYDGVHYEAFDALPNWRINGINHPSLPTPWIANTDGVQIAGSFRGFDGVARSLRSSEVNAAKFTGVLSAILN